MKARLDYGRTGLTVTIPDHVRVSVAEPAKGQPVADPQAAVAAALANPIGTRPLAEIARGRRNAVVVISDKTRPVPYGVVLPSILRTLEESGIAREAIEIIVATGLHRANSRAELIEMTSAELVDTYRFRNHVARNPDEHVHLGRTARGTEVWVDRGYIEADLKIITGLIEPHLMAGFSGGRKAVVPGLAAVDTMRTLHGAAILEEHIGPGIVAGNQFHEELIRIARLAGVDFMVDVSINRDRQLMGVFAGDLEQAHAAGVRFVEREVGVELDAPADIVITSAGGYPLDDTFYQAVKGMIAALNVVRRGGTIILAAAITEGIGSDEFQRLLRETRGNDDFMVRVLSPGFFTIDQWMVQHICQVRRKAETLLVCAGLPPETVRGLMVSPAASVEAALAQALSSHRAPVGQPPHVVVLPQGPYVIATVQGRKLSLGKAWMEQAA